MVSVHHRGVRAMEDELDVLPCLDMEQFIHPTGGQAPALPLVPCLVPCLLLCPAHAKPLSPLTCAPQARVWVPRVPGKGSSQPWGMMPHG